MRLRDASLIGLSVCFCGVGLFGVACGDDDNSNLFDNTADASADAKAAPTVTATATATGTTTTPGPDASDDGGTITDAGADADAAIIIPDGGAPPDPAKIACGTASCDVATQFCCQQPDAGESCQTSNGACSALGGARQECNEKADCPVFDAGAGTAPEAQVCCFDVTPNGFEAHCRLDCNGGGGTRFQACRTQNECQSGTCTVRTCNGDAGVTSTETCQPIPGICP
jgi:hypothetical protein